MFGTPKKIAILTQETGFEPQTNPFREKGVLYNRSIKLLIKEIEKRGHQVTLIPFLQYGIQKDGSLLGPDYERTKDNNGLAKLTKTKKMVVLNPKDFDLVVKRTWGPARTAGLAYYKHFITQGVRPFNNPEVIKLSHSKIRMGAYLKEKGVAVPETLRLRNPDYLLDNMGRYAAHFGRYFIIKGDVGTKAESVCFVDTHKEEFQQHIADFYKKYERTYNGDKGSKKGFVIQSYIQTHKDPNKSNYIRVNIVNGKIQSAVEYTGEYEKGKLVDGSRQDKPFFMTTKLSRTLQPIMRSSEFSKGVWGIDVVKDVTTGAYYVLEVNDGPMVSELYDLKKDNLNFTQGMAHTDCHKFPKAYANAIVQTAKVKDYKTTSHGLNTAQLAAQRNYYNSENIRG